MVKKILKITGLVLALAFIAIQFFQIDKTNPPIVETETLEYAVTVPADVSQTLARACNDCHSHKTAYPWYAYIQPSGWFLRSHIDDGRRHLNFSTFATYNAKKREHKLEEVCEMVGGGAMPLPSYLWIHGEAVLSDSDRKLLCDWANAERAKIDVSGA